MRVKDIEQLAQKKKGEKRKVFNPTTKDFTWNFNKKTYTVLQGEAKEFKIHIAEHLAKHLIDQILIEKGKDLRDEEVRNIWKKKILI